MATRDFMFCDEKLREQRNYLYPPDCRRPNPCAYVVIRRKKFSLCFLGAVPSGCCKDHLGNFKSHHHSWLASLLCSDCFQARSFRAAQECMRDAGEVVVPARWRKPLSAQHLCDGCIGTDLHNNCPSQAGDQLVRSNARTCGCIQLFELSSGGTHVVGFFFDREGVIVQTELF